MKTDTFVIPAVLSDDIIGSTVKRPDLSWFQGDYSYSCLLRPDGSLEVSFLNLTEAQFLELKAKHPYLGRSE